MISFIFANGTGVDKCVIDKELEVLFCSASSISSSRLGDARGHRLFDKAVLAGLERALCDLEVRRNRRRDHDDIDVGSAIDHFGCIRRRSRCRRNNFRIFARRSSSTSQATTRLDLIRAAENF